MPLAMNREVFITCAVTGSGGTQDRSPHVPRSPKQIANSAIEAAKAGAAIVHCHVRDPDTGKPRRDVQLYREVTERIRDADVDVVLNLTAGMGGDMVFGSPEAPLPLNEKGTDMGGRSAFAARRARSTVSNVSSYERSQVTGLSTSQEIVRSHCATSPACNSVSQWISPGRTAVGAGAQRMVTHRST